ncbi:MAG: response regulator [Aggregatilineales bacterium]
MTKILVVEDNEDNRDMLIRRLQRRGYETLAAVDGQQGVEMARSEKPDLILMDMSLPVLDGWQATRILKQNADTKRIPIIGLSANAMAGDREKGLSVGCDEYDTKPIEMPQLLEKIQTVLAKANATDGDSAILPGKS